VLSKRLPESSCSRGNTLQTCWFVLLQVAVFCIGIFLCVGSAGRMESDELPPFHLGDGVFTLSFFAYNVLTGVRDASAIAGLLLHCSFLCSLWASKALKAS